MNYAIYILVILNIYVVLSLSLSLLVGYGGLLSLAHASFYAVGAYITAYLTTRVGFSFFAALPAAILGSALLSLLLSIPSIRLRGNYFVLATLAFQVSTFTILYNWVALTGGPYGIADVRRPILLGFRLTSLTSFFLFSLTVTTIVVTTMVLLCHAPFGRTLKAIRDDETAAQAIGKNTTRFKIQAFLIACGMAAVSGSLYAGFLSYVDPNSFTLGESIFILSLVLIGGSGNLWGPVIGSVFIIGLSEALRFLGLPDSVAPNVRQMVLGALLVILMRFRPQGIAGEYRLE